VGTQEVKWEKGEYEEEGIIIFSMEKGTKIINWEQNFCTLQNSVSSYESRDF